MNRDRGREAATVARRPEPSDDRRSGRPVAVADRGRATASAALARTGLSCPVALVTGSSSGFGLLTSVALAARGHRVFATMRDLGRAQHLERAAAAAGVSVEPLELDVTRPASIARAVSTVHERAGRIDVLVNNAGFGIGGFLEDLDLGEIREQFETNFFGLLAVTKAVAGGMRERRRGRIVNVSSMGGRIGLPAMSAYCASKWAVEGFSEALRYELRPFDVFVALVEPGTFKTEVFARNRREARRATDPSSPYHDVYRRIIRGWEWNFGHAGGDPRRVAATIVAACVARRPRLRYLVGADARGAAAVKAFLPARWWEAAMTRWVAWLSRRGESS
jgi:NAD(P)-dependent dehydrogenase (short-subunit alcohol dehydrogenase family)